MAEDSVRRVHRPEDFEASYASTPPWDIGRPQPAFARLAEAGVVRGRVLDVGCGTGEHALMAAGMGLEATGVDLAPTAIARAQAKARERGSAAQFVVEDVLHLERLGARYDTVLDCGLFHVLDDGERREFIDGLRGAMMPGGRYLMLCFSDRQAGEWGPRRIREAEIRDGFREGWRVDSIEATRLDLLIEPGFAEAWLAQVSRI